MSGNHKQLEWLDSSIKLWTMIPVAFVNWQCSKGFKTAIERQSGAKPGRPRCYSLLLRLKVSSVYTQFSKRSYRKPVRNSMVSLTRNANRTLSVLVGHSRLVESEGCKTRPVKVFWFLWKSAQPKTTELTQLFVFLFPGEIAKDLWEIAHNWGNKKSKKSAVELATKMWQCMFKCTINRTWWCFVRKN